MHPTPHASLSTKVNFSRKIHLVTTAGAVTKKYQENLNKAGRAFNKLKKAADEVSAISRGVKRPSSSAQVQGRIPYPRQYKPLLITSRII